jgi:hypothetical protein
MYCFHGNLLDRKLGHEIWFVGLEFVAAKTAHVHLNPTTKPHISIFYMGWKNLYIHLKVYFLVKNII